MTKQRTSKQNQRQDEQYRENGKYSKVNPCQICNKSAGIEYFSHPLTDTGNWHDAGICLCKKCADKTQNITDVTEFNKLKKNES